MEGYERYWQARFKASQQDLVARLIGRDDDLLPYEPIAQLLQAYQQIPHSKPRVIPLDRIVGSVGRYRNFTRSFLPRGGVKPERWARIDAAMDSPEGVPPIEVYQIGDVYFVSDGNHRVSVARASGFREIEAYVTKIDVGVDVDLAPGDTLDQAIMKAECARFLGQTGLGERCGARAIVCTRPGGYTRLLEQIELHRRLMHADHPDMWQITFEQAAEDWYEEVYRPVVEAIERRGLLARFPGQTAADLYIAVAQRIREISGECAKDANLDEVVDNLAETRRPPMLQVILHALERLAELAGQVAAPTGLGEDWVAAPAPPIENEWPAFPTEREGGA